MRKVLLVHKEQYVDQAVKEALRLLGYERRRTSRYEVLDLLGVLVMPFTSDLFFAPKSITHGPDFVEAHTGVFSHESVSVNGIWLMLTINPLDPADAIQRHEALSRAIRALNTQERGHPIEAVIPISFIGDKEPVLAAEREHLEREHPEILIRSSLRFDFQDCFRDHSSLHLCSRWGVTLEQAP